MKLFTNHSLCAAVCCALFVICATDAFCYEGPATEQEKSIKDHPLGQDVISVYPNPIKNNVTFKLPETGKEPVYLKLNDSYSQVWYQGAAEIDHLSNEVSFPVAPSIPSGIYHAEIVIGNKKQIFRLVKK